MEGWLHPSPYYSYASAPKTKSGQSGKWVIETLVNAFAIWSGADNLCASRAKSIRTSKRRKSSDASTRRADRRCFTPGSAAAGFRWSAIFSARENARGFCFATLWQPFAGWSNSKSIRRSASESLAVSRRSSNDVADAAEACRSRRHPQELDDRRPVAAGHQLAKGRRRIHHAARSLHGRSRPARFPPVESRACTGSNSRAAHMCPIEKSACITRYTARSACTMRPPFAAANGCA